MDIRKYGTLSALKISLMVAGVLVVLLALGWLSSLTTSRYDVSMINQFLQAHALGLLIWRMFLYVALILTWPYLLRQALKKRRGYTPSQQQINGVVWKLAVFILIFELFIVQNIVGRIVKLL